MTTLHYNSNIIKMVTLIKIYFLKVFYHLLYFICCQEE